MMTMVNNYNYASSFSFPPFSFLDGRRRMLLLLMMVLLLQSTVLFSMILTTTSSFVELPPLLPHHHHGLCNVHLSSSCHHRGATTATTTTTTTSTTAKTLFGYRKPPSPSSLKTITTTTTTTTTSLHLLSSPLFSTCLSSSSIYNTAVTTLLQLQQQLLLLLPPSISIFFRNSIIFRSSRRLTASILVLGIVAFVGALYKTNKNHNNHHHTWIKKFLPKNLPTPDPAFREPLPDGSLGCPYFGNLSFFTRMGNAQTGTGEFYRFQLRRTMKTVAAAAAAAASVSASSSSSTDIIRSGTNEEEVEKKKKKKKKSNVQLYKLATLGRPSVIIAGISSVKKVFNKEFKAVKTGVMTPEFTKAFGGESLLFVTDQERHQFLRRLVGQAMTPEQIDEAMPALIQSATRMLNTLTTTQGGEGKEEDGKTVEMERVLTAFTLDVAWRQILGLNLKDDETDKFNQAVNDWIIGFLNPVWMILPGRRFSKSAKAFKYLVAKIEERLDELDRSGPDGSTLSGMYFAKDEEDPSKKLSKSDIISNSLLLIFAGSETAASTLTVAMLALGLHKDVFQKLKSEQLAMMTKYEGIPMTREMLEKDCPYLDAVVKEVMRIKPLSLTGAMRFAQETFIVDGKQIPKGYGVAFSPGITHLIDPSVKEEDDAHMDIVKGFKPERWLDDTTKPTDYIPFGVGPRYCLGVNLALAEMKVFLALFARRVEFHLTNTTPDNVEWKNFSIIPKPKDGALITVTKLCDANLTPVVNSVGV